MGVTRRHWFWRAAIAVLEGCLAFAALIALSYVLREVTGYRPDGIFIIGYFCVVVVLPTLFCTAVAAIIRTRREFDNETRCRKCRYILRGIPEPRCPECGEQI